MFLPETSLPGSVYIPFYSVPTRRIGTVSDFQIESNAQGLQSIINLMSNQLSIFPFFDISKYDGERRGWLWEDANGLFFKLLPKGDKEFDSIITALGWSDNPIPINYILSGVDISRSVPISDLFLSISDDSSNSNFFKRRYVSLFGEAFYRYDPIQVVINGIPLIDKTDYSGLGQSVLSDTKTDINAEFYYNFKENKIYTNQNMAGVQANSVIVKFFININTVSILNNMSTNVSTNAPYTPVVDYYILKLNGQNYGSI